MDMEGKFTQGLDDADKSTRDMDFEDLEIYIPTLVVEHGE
jgi:hypothetical protein